MREFIIISRQVIERELTVRASSASEAMRLARENVEASDFFQREKTDQPGIIDTSDVQVLSKRFRHGGPVE